MNMKKIVASAAALSLTAAVAVGGTLAWLTQEKSITNTFTFGNNIAITLDEADLNGEPGDRTSENQTYTTYVGALVDKDPTIHVGATSGDCYVFAKIENGFAAGVATPNLDTTKWKAVTGAENIYYYEDNGDAVMSAGESAVVFTQVQFSNTVTSVDDLNNKTITVTGYAVQKDGFTSAQAAWDATFGAPQE